MNCFATLGGGARFAHIVPLYLYAVKTAYPEAMVKVFWYQKLPEDVEAMLISMRNMRELQHGWEVIEGCFDEMPVRVSMFNSLRVLLPEKAFSGMEIVSITDLDMIITRAKVSHFDYYAEVMKSCGTCYAACGGAKVKPKRPQINGGAWSGDFTRINNTMFAVSRRWFDKTSEARAYYYRHLRNQVHDELDNITPATYREYDEVMHYRILKASGLPAPKKKFRFLDDRLFDIRYRDIHLGDFIHENRYNRFEKMSRLIKKSVLRQYLKLKQSPHWNEIAEFSNSEPTLRTMLRRLDKHCQARLGTNV